MVAPITTLLCILYWKISSPFDPSHSHVEFCVLLNNLQIVNRHRLIFPIVLFITMILFTSKVCSGSTIKSIEPIQEEEATEYAYDKYKIRIHLNHDEDESSKLDTSNNSE